MPKAFASRLLEFKHPELQVLMRLFAKWLADHPGVGVQAVCVYPKDTDWVVRLSVYPLDLEQI